MRKLICKLFGHPRYVQILQLRRNSEGMYVYSPSLRCVRCGSEPQKPKLRG